MRNRLVLFAVLTSLFALGTVPATAGETTTTFTITGGALQISVPDTQNLGAVAVTDDLLDLVGTPSGSFADPITVTDARGALVANWTVNVTGSDFDLQTAGAEPGTNANQRVTPASVTYDPGTVDMLLGSLGSLTVGTPGTLAAGASITFTGIGSNKVEWTPDLEFDLLDTQVAGEYKGTITHDLS